MSETKVFSLFEAKRLGESLKIDWKRFDVEQFHMGLEIEMEHGLCDLTTDVTHSNPTLTAKIESISSSGIGFSSDEIGQIRTRIIEGMRDLGYELRV